MHEKRRRLIYAQVGKLYTWMINASIVTRWILFIVPMLGIIWIPGILSLTKFPKAHVSNSLSLCCRQELILGFCQVAFVRLIWWSIWFTILWAGELHYSLTCGCVRFIHIIKAGGLPWLCRG